MLAGGTPMNMRKWWPWWTIGIAAVIVGTAYPMYFRWWDNKSCHESGGRWDEAQHACIEPRNADIPNTSGSTTMEDDNQSGESKRQ